MKRLFGLIGLCALLSSATNTVVAQDDAIAERLTAIKTSLADSQKKIRAYQWIETTVVTLKGEEKSRFQDSCYYGDDGVLQKVPVGAAPEPPEKHRGLRGRIAEHKREELTEEMQAAVALMHQYVPPDARRMQAAKDAGNVSIEIIEVGKRARLVFANYLKPQDSLGLEIDLATNSLKGIKVTTYLESPDKPVTLDVRYKLLKDGTAYVAKTVLDDVHEKLQVTVENSGYRKLDEGDGEGGR